MQIENALRSDIDHELITKIQLAVRLKVSTRTIDMWMSKNLVPYRKIGRTVRFSWSEVCKKAGQKMASELMEPAKMVTPIGIALTLRDRAREIRSRSINTKA
jgi:excisionase family DNA binding protein